MKRLLDGFNNLYPVWLVSVAVMAFFKPSVDAVVQRELGLLVAGHFDAGDGTHAES
jgi:hypothetical protein